MILTLFGFSQIVSNIDPYGQIIIHLSQSDADQNVFHYDMSQIQGQRLNADVFIQARFYQTLHSRIKESETFEVYSEDRITGIVSCNVINDTRPYYCQDSTVVVLNTINNATAVNIETPRFTQHATILVQITPKQFGAKPFNKTIEMNFGDDENQNSYVKIENNVIGDIQAKKYHYLNQQNSDLYNYYLDPDSQIAFQLQFKPLYSYFRDYQWIINNQGKYFSYNNYKSQNIPSFCNKLPTNITAWRENIYQGGYQIRQIPLNKYVTVNDQGYCNSDDGGKNSISNISNSQNNNICEQLGCTMNDISIQDNQFQITNLGQYMSLMMMFPVNLVTFQNIYTSKQVVINASIIQTNPQRINISVLSKQTQILGQYVIKCGEYTFVIKSDFYKYNEQRTHIFNFTDVVKNSIICELKNSVLELNKTEMAMIHNSTFISKNCGLHIKIKANTCLTFCANDTIYDRVKQYCIPKKCPQAYPVFDPQTLSCVTNANAQKLDIYKSPFELLNLLIKPTQLDCGRGTSDPVTGLCSCPSGYETFIQQENTVKMCQKNPEIRRPIMVEYSQSKLFQLFLGNFSGFSVFKLVGGLLGTSLGVFGLIALFIVFMVARGLCGCMSGFFRCIALCFSCKKKSAENHLLWK